MNDLEIKYSEFLESDDRLRVYDDDILVFSSRQERLRGLLEYIDSFAAGHQRVIVLDKIMGNAAALLSIKAGCQEVYSPLGSRIAANTLDKYNITNHISRIIPHIRKPDGTDMCPMEKLSINAGPEEFYKAVKKAFN